MNKTRIPWLIYSAIAGLFALSTSAMAQADHRTIVGTWYTMNYLEGKTDIVTVSREGGQFIARTARHTYALTRTLGGFEGTAYATPREVQQNVHMVTGVMTAGMASSASAQRAMWFRIEIGAKPDREGNINYVSLTEDFGGRSFIHNNARVNYIPMGVKVILNWSRKPEFTSDFDLAKYIHDQKGSVDFAMKDLFAKELGPLGMYRPSLGLSGHRYIAINLVARGIRRKPAFQLMKDRFADAFPLSVKDGDGVSAPKPLAVGEEYLLTSDSLEKSRQRALNPSIRAALDLLLPTLSQNKIRVLDMNDYDFTVQAIPGQHVLRGTATHGLFEDAVGDLYMYQVGRGIEWENPVRMAGNVMGADVLWTIFATRLGDLIPKR